MNTRLNPDGEELVPLRMDAYYYSFTPTGVEAIDRILCAVASAGKAYHNTDCWSKHQESERANCDGQTPVQWIQNAANEAAKTFPDTTTMEGQWTFDERDGLLRHGKGECFILVGGYGEKLLPRQVQPILDALNTVNTPDAHGGISPK